MAEPASTMIASRALSRQRAARCARCDRHRRAPGRRVAITERQFRGASVTTSGSTPSSRRTTARMLAVDCGRTEEIAAVSNPSRDTRERARFLPRCIAPNDEVRSRVRRSSRASLIVFPISMHRDHAEPRLIRRRGNRSVPSAGDTQRTIAGDAPHHTRGAHAVCSNATSRSM